MSSSELPTHPFYPRDLKLNGYVPNDLDSTGLLVPFFGVLGVSLVGLWIVMGTRKHLQGRLVSKMKIGWFFLCALIHIFLEGYFAVYHETLTQKMTLLAQMLKEYGKADSRYVSSDTCITSVEGLTAFVVGPLSLIATYAFLANRPNRNVVQMIISVCQLYGTIIYFVSEAKDGFIHSHPEFHPLYFWFYFVFLNSFWLVVPFICIVEAYIKLSSVQSTSDKPRITENSTKKKH